MLRAATTTAVELRMHDDTIVTYLPADRRDSMVQGTDLYYDHLHLFLYQFETIQELCNSSLFLAYISP